MHSKRIFRKTGDGRITFKQTSLDERAKFQKYCDFQKRVGACANCGMSATPAYLQKFSENFQKNFYPTAGKITKFGHGAPDSKLMMVGQAPSKSPKSNIIFGAKSKELYEKFLEILDEERESVWQTNLVKCYVPKKEVGDEENCLSFLKREIEIINPSYIVLFGREVVNTVLEKGINLAGEVITPESYEEVERIYITSYHPCYPLYAGEKGKEKLWSCAKKIKEVIKNGKPTVFERENKR